MKSSRSKFSRYFKKCWKQISSRDKGLISIMIVLLFQCICNLYTSAPINSEYDTINVIIRTSMASIFGYFLSSNFLSDLDQDNDNPSTEQKLFILEQLLEDEKISKKVKFKYNKKLKESFVEEKEEKEIYFCNKELQNGIAISICLIIVFSLIIGVNFNLISDAASVTIAQFRDLISGCIGFLLGNKGNSDSKKSANRK